MINHCHPHRFSTRPLKDTSKKPQQKKKKQQKNVPQKNVPPRDVEDESSDDDDAGEDSDDSGQAEDQSTLLPGKFATHLDEVCFIKVLFLLFIFYLK